MTFEREGMAKTKDKYYTKMLENIVDYHDSNNSPLSNKNIWQAVSSVVAETEEEERDAKGNVNNITNNTFFHQSPITNNTQGEIANVKS